MKVHIKEGVCLKEINERLIHLCITSWWIWQKYGLDPVITSCNDGNHMKGSLHYNNMAWDLRIWGLPDVKAAALELDGLLNIRHHDYDVVVESDHLHVEFDPKTVDEDIKLC